MSHESVLKVQRNLGLCLRAGRLISGEELVLDAIRDGKARLVLLTTDASVNTSKRITDKCLFYKVPLQVAFTRGELGEAIGKAERVVVAITDNGFKKLISEGLKNMEVNGIDETSR
jgi:ribosomal protein L7Ae-like RNA K-turn-binding protein